MARTIEQILQEQIGQMSFGLAAHMARIEAMQERLDAIKTKMAEYPEFKQWFDATYPKG